MAQTRALFAISTSGKARFMPTASFGLSSKPLLKRATLSLACVQLFCRCSSCLARLRCRRGSYCCRCCRRRRYRFVAALFAFPSSMLPGDYFQGAFSSTKRLDQSCAAAVLHTSAAQLICRENDQVTEIQQIRTKRKSINICSHTSTGHTKLSSVT